MSGLRAILAAFAEASGAQKVTIGVALLVIVAAMANASSPAGSREPATGTGPPTAAAPALAVLATGGLATPPPEAFSSIEPEPTPLATPEATTTPSTPPTPPPTPKPTPKPTPAPTPKPTTFSLTFTSLTTPIDPNEYATAKVKTAAGASCTIDVEYKSGPSTAAGLGPKTASSSGIASWTWKVGGRTTPGSWPVTVTCSKSGKSKSVTRYLDVL